MKTTLHKLYPLKWHPLIVLQLFFLLLPYNLQAQPESFQVDINWKKFLSKQDLIWQSLPQAWDEGPFLGNGMMGAIIFKEPHKNEIHFELGSSEVRDHRGTGEHDNVRLMIGHFALQTKGNIKNGTMRLDLRNAEATGSIETDVGKIHFRCFIHSEDMLGFIEVKTTGDEKEFRWQWHPAQADSPRHLYGLKKKSAKHIDKNYHSNPAPILKSDGDNNLCIQPLLAGGETVTAWQQIKSKRSQLLYFNVSHSFPGSDAQSIAVSTLEKIHKHTFTLWQQSHRAWWHSYYQQSYFSTSEKELEKFYWIQMYKLGSATRHDRPLIDNTGPWLWITPWPNAWWNLNVQLTYWPLYTANRLSLAKSLSITVFSNEANLIQNVPQPYRYNAAGIGRSSALDCKSDVGLPGEGAEVGLLTWTCHNLWLEYRHTMNDTLLRHKLFPLLKRSINYYLHFLTEQKDGKLHLPLTYSPEYGTVEDCNFDLALIRWGCKTLLEINSRLKLNDHLQPRWQKVLDDLTDFPQDSTGYLIGRGVPYNFSHRHYSHLLMIYPLHLINPNDTIHARIIKRSLQHWQSKPQALQGYSYTGAASIEALLGDGNKAHAYLMGLFSKFLRPNTFYKEAGPVIETPLSGAQAMHDMVLQSWGNTINVFPAVPTHWKNVSFHNLSAEGGFLVSAARHDGITNFIRIKSLAGEPCILKTKLSNLAGLINGKKMQPLKMGKHLYTIDLKKNEEIILYNATAVKHPFIISNHR